MSTVPYSFVRAIRDGVTNTYDTYDTCRIPGILVLANKLTPRLCVPIRWDEPNEYGITPINVKRYIQYVEEHGHNAEFIPKPGLQQIAGYFIVDYYYVHE